MMTRTNRSHERIGMQLHLSLDLFALKLNIFDKNISSLSGINNDRQLDKVYLSFFILQTLQKNLKLSKYIDARLVSEVLTISCTKKRNYHLN